MRSFLPVIHVILMLINGMYLKENHDVVAQIFGNLSTIQLIVGKYGFQIDHEVLNGSCYYLLKTNQTRKRRWPTSSLNGLIKEKQVEWVEKQIPQRRVKRILSLDDPMWQSMWYMNTMYKTGRYMNIEGAWRAGYTGKGIVVTVLDDGLEINHPDIKANYEPLASTDLNDRDSNPNARIELSSENRHGTRCAGEIAAGADNSVCSTGVAFDCRIGGIRMLDGDVTDLIEAEALSFRPDIVDIYSASWGPEDNGRTVDGPGRLATLALEWGAKKGRLGKGSIYVWASGNGGKDDDNCNCDGYANSIYTITVSGVTENGDVPWYAEICSAALVSAYSSGSSLEKKIITTDINHGCTISHSGTSASAPLVAGIIALMLEANEDLSWRDVQYILVLACRTQRLKGTGWTRNGAGFTVSPYFGFGLVDARLATLIARQWNPLPPQHQCVYDVIPRHLPSRFIGPGEKSVISFYANGCKMKRNEINFVEHIQIILTLRSAVRGDVQISLISPMKTNSTLLHFRSKDLTSLPFKDWPFMSTHFWGENPRGKWILEVHYRNRKYGFRPSVLENFTIIIFGTSELPIPVSLPSNRRDWARYIKKQLRF